MEAANIWFASQVAKSQDRSPIQTVQEAVESYVAMRSARKSARAGREVRSTAARLALHVPADSALASKRLDQLTEVDLGGWLSGLAVAKETTKKRICSDFKAALNRAYSANRKRLPTDLAYAISAGLRVGRSTDDNDVSIARDNQILDDDAVRRLIDAAFQVDNDGDVARVVVVLAATGARFSQIQRMLVRDVQAEQLRMLVPTSRKGRGRRAVHYRVQVGADVIRALEPVLKGRAPDDLLLERWHYARDERDGRLWRRARRGEWFRSSELTEPWRKIAEAAGMAGVIPYALRHSSIVRGIRCGLPIRLVAALHDTSVEMVERYYSRWITDGLDEMAARAVVPLVA